MCRRWYTFNKRSKGGQRFPKEWDIEASGNYDYDWGTSGVSGTFEGDAWSATEWFGFYDKGVFVVEEEGCYEFNLVADSRAIMKLDNKRFIDTHRGRYRWNREICFGADRVNEEVPFTMLYKQTERTASVNMEWETPTAKANKDGFAPMPLSAFKTGSSRRMLSAQEEPEMIEVD